MPYQPGQLIEVLVGKRAGQSHPVVDVFPGDDDREFPARPGVSIRDEDTELFYGLDEIRFPGERIELDPHSRGNGTAGV